ncbi:MAG: class I SAM-dependent methyltransferase [Anaerolineae bacterium]|nr:class I SAM-dependent methyltransferase [Anaerolineae bacterium]
MNPTSNLYDEVYFQRLVGYSRLTGRDYREYRVRGLRRLLRSYNRKSAAILDVACGDGFYVHSLASDFALVGGDVSIDGIRRSEKWRGLKLYQGDFCNLPFRDASWDSILALDVLEHLHSPQKALAEAYRVLKPGGYFILSVPNAGSFGNRLKGQEWFAYSDSTHVNLLDVPTWREILKTSGFCILRDGTDTPWDVPYPIIVPKVLQKPVSNLITILVRTTIVFLPWERGENYNAICMKRLDDGTTHRN